MKNKKAVFFDLDGTLVPLEQERMFGEYWRILRESELIRLLADDPDNAIDMFNAAAIAMMSSRGGCPNKNVFFDRLEALTGKGRKHFSEQFDNFYASVFEAIGWMVEKKGVQRAIIDTLAEKGYRRALATMPVFPIGAAVSRLAWVGLKPDDFEYITHWENTNYMKPQPGYYKEILQMLGLDAEDCLMVGNNVKEDMCAQKLGFDVFLVTGYEIGEYNKSDFPNGSLEELLAWVQYLPYAEVAV